MASLVSFGFYRDNRGCTISLRARTSYKVGGQSVWQPNFDSIASDSVGEMHNLEFYDLFCDHR